MTSGEVDFFGFLAASKLRLVRPVAGVRDDRRKTP
jgi:hypothetical protein